MDSKQHLYYALGALAYAVAKADGKVQVEEKEKVREIVDRGLQHNIDFNYTDIIFQILQKDKMGFKDVYQWAMHSFETAKYHLTPEIKKQFIKVIEEVAEAFPPTDPNEKALIARFGHDIEKLSVKTAHD
ncbi:MAG: TerB family tellurite resistance protein [Crocinitomicaceae bacterium]|nr:TerB family tellurite resistance protein [Crocinitomicaceae bacterium]